jgi:hypothetical protein
MTKPTVTNIKAGAEILAGYKRRNNDFVDPQRFLGFKYNGLWFSDLRTLKEFMGVKNLREVEFEADRLEGGSVTAEFRDADADFLWGAYLWNGAFRVGTSADRLVLRAA